ncbi:MAG: DUF3394 domain-containing protein [Rhodospirillaceae bacterium]|nr:DUF3394 domain-containing protein [Rhodospirillaceae bacterium]
MAKSRIWESIALLLIAFTLFRPGFWMDYISPPFEHGKPADLVTALGKAVPGSEMRLIVEGQDDVGDPITFTAILPVSSEATGEERLAAYGLEILVEDGKVLIDGTTFDSPAAKAGLDFDQVIQTVLVPVDQPSKLLMYIPALVLLGFIVLLQRRRNGVAAEAAAPA